MTTINAQSIINTINAAALVAPEYCPHTERAAYLMALAKDTEYSAPYGFELENHADTECQAPARWKGDKAQYQQAPAIVAQYDHLRATLRAARIGAIVDALPPVTTPRRITFQTSERGRMTVQNLRANLERFAAKVRANAAAFGGGLTKAPRAKPAQSWPANALKVARECMENHDYAGALDIGADKLGALFYIGNPGKNGSTFAIFAPVACDAPELAGLYSGMKENGDYTLFDMVSGVGVDGYTKARTRAAAIGGAIQRIFANPNANLARAIEKAQANYKHDQAAALALWKTERGIVDLDAIESNAAALQDTNTDDTTATIEAAAARDVAQVVANATAAAVIEQASEAAELTQVATVTTSEATTAQDPRDVAKVDAVARELVTCEGASMGANTNSTSSAQHGHAAGLAHGGNTSTTQATTTARTGQTIAGKSGNWSALFFVSDTGAPSMEFRQAGRVPCVVEFESGRDRMRALQQSAKWADQAAAPAPQATSEATDNTSSTAKRAPRPYTPQVLEFDLRGITWKIEVSRYWEIVAVAEMHHPDILCWRAYKKGGRYHATTFAKVAGDKVPRDVATRAAAFCDACIAADLADQTAQAATDTPTPPAPAAPSAGHTPADTGADYTDTRKTSSTSADGLHDTPQDLEPATPAPMATAKPGAFSITITRGEGLIEECGKTATVASFADADALLMQWSETAPKTGGYDKCDFSIQWANGDTYEGRYDLKHHTCERPSLAQHMIDECEFYTGKYCPAHMSAAAYQKHIEQTSDENRAAYAAILATMATQGAYFPKVRPVAIDLRALVAQGVEPSQLVGLGVAYCGDRCNSSSNGAITAVEPCDWQGFRLVVTTEDGAIHHARPADFGTEPGARYRLDAKNHGAPYLAQLAGAVATAKANVSAAKEQAAKAHAQALADLAREYAHLKQYKEGDKLRGVTLAAANVRILLKQAFPGVKFSVTCDKYSMGNSLNVTWTDGPTYAQVDAIVDKFSAGHFNSMEDIYEYNSSAFTELFGSAKHTSTRRELGDATIGAALLSLFGENGPSVEDFRTSKAWREVNHGNHPADYYTDQWAWMMAARRQAEQTGNE